jgi:hypothetical protein
MKLMLSCFSAVNNGMESVPAKLPIHHSHISALSIMIKDEAISVTGRGDLCEYETSRFSHVVGSWQ